MDALSEHVFEELINVLDPCLCSSLGEHRQLGGEPLIKSTRREHLCKILQNLFPQFKDRYGAF